MNAEELDKTLTGDSKGGSLNIPNIWLWSALEELEKLVFTQSAV